jgi:hypothetical protein
MRDYVTTAANFEATGAALMASDHRTRRIHRPDLAPRGAEEVTPTQTTH